MTLFKLLLTLFLTLFDFSRCGPEVKGAGGTCTRSGSRHQVEGQGGAASFVERVNVGAGTGMVVAGARLSTSISGRMKNSGRINLINIYIE